jgi:predicted nuclease of predicted toxin-antitoxin system
LKVDENLPDQLADLLVELGHDAVTVTDQGWRGIADLDLWRGVQAERRWLVTADKEFGDIRRYPAGSHAGVILLRLAEQSRVDYLRLVKAAVASLDLDNLAGAIVVVTDRGVRIRRAEIHR